MWTNLLIGFCIVVFLLMSVVQGTFGPYFPFAAPQRMMVHECPAGGYSKIRCRPDLKFPDCAQGFECVRQSVLYEIDTIFCGVCCPVTKHCPKGSIRGPYCNYSNKCPRGFLCQNGVCCKSRKSGKFCPAGSRRGRHCSLTFPCKPGNICIKGICCTIPNLSPSCPVNHVSLKGITCTLDSHCPGISSCHNSICCQPEKQEMPLATPPIIGPPELPVTLPPRTLPPNHPVPTTGGIITIPPLTTDPVIIKTVPPLKITDPPQIITDPPIVTEQPQINLNQNLVLKPTSCPGELRTLPGVTCEHLLDCPGNSQCISGLCCAETGMNIEMQRCPVSYTQVPNINCGLRQRCPGNGLCISGTCCIRPDITTTPTCPGNQSRVTHQSCDLGTCTGSNVCVFGVCCTAEIKPAPKVEICPVGYKLIENSICDVSCPMDSICIKGHCCQFMSPVTRTPDTREFYIVPPEIPTPPSNSATTSRPKTFVPATSPPLIPPQTFPTPTISIFPQPTLRSVTLKPVPQPTLPPVTLKPVPQPTLPPVTLKPVPQPTLPPVTLKPVPQPTLPPITFSPFPQPTAPTTAIPPPPPITFKPFSLPSLPPDTPKPLAPWTTLKPHPQPTLPPFEYKPLPQATPSLLPPIIIPTDPGIVPNQPPYIIRTPSATVKPLNPITIPATGPPTVPNTMPPIITNFSPISPTLPPYVPTIPVPTLTPIPIPPPPPLIINQTIPATIPPAFTVPTTIGLPQIPSTPINTFIPTFPPTLPPAKVKPQSSLAPVVTQNNRPIIPPLLANPAQTTANYNITPPPILPPSSLRPHPRTFQPINVTIPPYPFPPGVISTSYSWWGLSSTHSPSFKPAFTSPGINETTAVSISSPKVGITTSVLPTQPVPVYNQTTPPSVTIPVINPLPPITSIPSIRHTTIRNKTYPAIPTTSAYNPPYLINTTTRLPHITNSVSRSTTAVPFYQTTFPYFLESTTSKRGSTTQTRTTTPPVSTPIVSVGCPPGNISISGLTCNSIYKCPAGSRCFNGECCLEYDTVKVPACPIDFLSANPCPQPREPDQCTIDMDCGPFMICCLTSCDQRVCKPIVSPKPSKPRK